MIGLDAREKAKGHQREEGDTLAYVLASFYCEVDR